MTTETTDTAARCQLEVLMDHVVQDRGVVIVWRRQGGDVALLGADELERLLEAAQQLRSPRNVTAACPREEPWGHSQRALER
jgi:PHD/YefM family antitoxin component YafN of YafNO toxin-antitoxin module